MLALVTDLLGLVPEGARGGNVVEQALGDQLVAQRAEILAPDHAVGDVGQAVPGRRLHQLEILLVLRGGAGRDLVEKLAGVAGIGAAELGEHAKEMVVAGHALGRHEAAHGK